MSQTVKMNLKVFISNKEFHKNFKEQSEKAGEKKIIKTYFATSARENVFLIKRLTYEMHFHVVLLKHKHCNILSQPISLANKI